VSDKDLERIDKALLSTRQRAIECMENGQPATITTEIILKTGGKVAAAVVGVRENIRME
jgi:hypothetical protein